MENDDPEMQRLWELVNELSEQLSQNRALTASLQAQVGLLKARAAVSRHASLTMSPRSQRGKLRSAGQDRVCEGSISILPKVSLACLGNLRLP